MKAVVALLSFALTGAAPGEDTLSSVENLEGPFAASEGFEGAQADEQRCRDSIQVVRDERGLPQLDRRPASPEEPLLIYTVDREIDGCDVLVMAGGEGRDIRPLPLPQEGPLLQPAH